MTRLTAQSIFLALSICSLSCVPANQTVNEWTHYGSDAASSKYSPLDQINGENVQRLEIAWRWNSPDNQILQTNPELWSMVYEATPLMIDGVLYTSTSMSQVVALDAATGTTIWSYDPETHEGKAGPNVGFVHRGVSYWEDGDDRRVLIGTGDAYLIALHAKSGKLIADFGQQGRVDLTQGLRRPVERGMYGVTSPPLICRDTVIVGSAIYDFGVINSNFPVKEMPPGDVRGYDVRSGQQRWVFHSIPQEGEFGVETWEEDSWSHTGNANVWTTMSCDEELGYAYLPLTSASHDVYGGHRPGDNLFAESLVAVDAETGKRVWHFQMVHHGLWDYDLPAAPTLVDVTVDGRPIKAVAQVSKQAFCYVFDRVTGKPLWPIEERPVPQSNVPGEKTSPSQPFPTKPLPYDLQGLRRDDVIDFTPELREKTLKILEEYEYGPLFTPPSVEKTTILIPGTTGGASWAGAAVNPESGVFYVTSVTAPEIVTLIPPKSPDSFYRYGSETIDSLTGYQGLPVTKPPYGRVTAIDLNTGEHLWMSAVGDGPRNHPALAHLDLPRLGWARRNFLLLTKTLLFLAQEGDRWIRGFTPVGTGVEYGTKSSDPYLRAFDPNSGELTAEILLPGNATGSPMTYTVGGKQFITIPIGGASQPAELVALSLP